MNNSIKKNYYKQQLNKVTLCIFTFSEFRLCKLGLFRRKFEYAVNLSKNVNEIRWLNYYSYNFHLFVHSVLPEEINTLADCFNEHYTMKHKLERMLRGLKPNKNLTDLEVLINICINHTADIGNRLKIDNRSARQSIDKEWTFQAG